MNFRRNSSISFSTIYIIMTHHLFLLIMWKHMKQSIPLHFCSNSFSNSYQFIWNLYPRPIARYRCWLNTVTLYFTRIMTLLKRIRINHDISFRAWYHTCCAYVFTFIFFSFIGIFKIIRNNQASCLHTQRCTMIIRSLSLLKIIIINHDICFHAQQCTCSIWIFTYLFFSFLVIINYTICLCDQRRAWHICVFTSLIFSFIGELKRVRNNQAIYFRAQRHTCYAWTFTSFLFSFLIRINYAISLHTQWRTCYSCAFDPLFFLDSLPRQLKHSFNSAPPAITLKFAMSSHWHMRYGCLSHLGIWQCAKPTGTLLQCSLWLHLLLSIIMNHALSKNHISPRD